MLLTAVSCQCGYFCVLYSIILAVPCPCSCGRRFWCCSSCIFRGELSLAWEDAAGVFPQHRCARFVPIKDQYFGTFVALHKFQFVSIFVTKKFVQMLDFLYFCVQMICFYLPFLVCWLVFRSITALASWHPLQRAAKLKVPISMQCFPVTLTFSLGTLPRFPIWSGNM